MIQPPLRALLVTPIGVSALLAEGLLAAAEAAIALATITTPTKIEHGAARRKVTDALSKDLGRGTRHQFGKGALDNRRRSWQHGSRQ
jgi:hypothetical protein